MKIGILTLPLHWNYGGILQYWALQQVLGKMGHESIKLERVNSNISFLHKIKADTKTYALRMIGKGKNVSLLIHFILPNYP